MELAPLPVATWDKPQRVLAITSAILLTVNSQWIAKMPSRQTVSLMRVESPDARITKSQVRDPQYLEMATRGIVEVRMSGEDNDVVMLPRKSLVGMEKVQLYSELYLRVSIAARFSRLPRALLGEVAFFLDLEAEERDRFLTDFAEAVGESIRTNDPRPAEFIFNAYRNAPNVTVPDIQMFSGEYGKDAEQALADRFTRA